MVVMLLIGAVLMGLVLRTFIPYLFAALYTWRETLVWPRFDKGFWVPPVASLCIAVLSLVALALTRPDLLTSLAQGSFWTIVMAVYVLQDLTRDAQKVAVAHRDSLALRAEWADDQGD